MIIMLFAMVLFYTYTSMNSTTMREYQWNSKGSLAGDVYSIIEFSQKLLSLNTMSNDESSSYMQPMESRSRSSNDSATECNPPGFNLPTIHQDDFFVGRENDISMVVSMMESAHIININGAPGIGKSTLAIHVGYELLRNGTSVYVTSTWVKRYLCLKGVGPQMKDLVAQWCTTQNKWRK